jgi:hypothetical protein
MFTKRFMSGKHECRVTLKSSSVEDKYQANRKLKTIAVYLKCDDGGT